MLGTVLLLTMSACAVTVTGLLPHRGRIDPTLAVALGVGTTWGALAYTAGRPLGGWTVLLSIGLALAGAGLLAVEGRVGSASPTVNSAPGASAPLWIAGLGVVTALYAFTDPAELQYAGPYVVAGALQLISVGVVLGCRGRLQAGDRRVRLAVIVAAGIAMVACSLAGDGFGGGWVVVGMLAALAAAWYLPAGARRFFGEPPFNLRERLSGAGQSAGGPRTSVPRLTRPERWLGAGVVAALVLCAIIAGVRDSAPVGSQAGGTSPTTSAQRPAPQATNRPIPAGLATFPDCDRGSSDVRLLFGPADASVRIVVDGTVINDGPLATQLQTRGDTNTVDNVGAEVSGLCNANVAVQMTVRSTSGTATCSLEENTYRSPDPPVRNTSPTTASCAAVLTGSQSSAGSSPSQYQPPPADVTIPGCAPGQDSMPLMITYTGESSGVDESYQSIDGYMDLAEDVWVDRTVAAKIGVPTRFDVPCRTTQLKLSAFYNGQWVLSSPLGAVLAKPTETPSDLYVAIQH
ncbi:hypothetical protein [Actinomycetospora soli]|uniref:hypothetical protein n=1 Tax=Actinomycetospora soli TaxID=2893887 RepID=UPI001E2EE7E1|nr:hypothetical protein [Actinomycetospora soli]MCD2191609.1 hypothetical protein [Actinomycetospora soli]